MITVLFVENNPDIQTKPQPVWIAVPAAAVRKKKTHCLAFTAMKKCVSVRQINGARNEGGSFMRKKSFTSALAVLLSLMMILVLFPANAFAMEGEGTTDHPYEIAAASDLDEFATKVNAGETTACAVLTADITISIDTNWTPIGNDSNQYNGIFDGGGHTITGLSVDIQSDDTIFAGLFGYIGEGGTIKNVGLEDSKITCSSTEGSVCAGGVCGYNAGGTIENCYNTGDVSGTGTSSNGTVYAGGVCGYNAGGTIENCYNTGDVSGTGTSSNGTVYAGGVCGQNYHGTIENCHNTGDVSGTSSYGYVYAGGVCGLNYHGTIQNCYNTGEVSGTGTSSYGYVYAGGVCGYNAGGTIENCYNTGDVSGTSSNGTVYAGGVCGYNRGDTTQNCYWLAGTADCGIGNPPGDTNAQSKTADEFASGEAAWLLNEPQTEKPWGQGSNNMPVLEGNLPDGVTSKTPVRITIVMQDNSEQYRYTTEGSTVAAYPTGYAFFFKDGDTKTWISKGTRTYDADATIYAENMTLEKIPEKAATCTADGHSAYWYCAAFDKYFSDENGVNEITAKDTVIPATGHGEAEVKGAKEATCTEDGYTGDKVCKVCEEILERGTVIEKIGHVWGEPEWNWSEDGTSCTVTFTCKNNPEHKETPQVSVTSAVKTPATCTESGVTTYTAAVEFNGQTYTDTKEISVPATGHELKKTDAKEPTCTEDGNKEYWTCDTCDKYFSDENAETEIQLADTVIEATGHSYDNGKCTVCGEIDPDFKAVIIEGANGTWQKGTKDGLSFTSNATFADFQKVQVDGKDLDASNYTVKEGSTIVTLKAADTGTATTEFTIKAAAAVDGDTESPQTGDDSNMALWITLMFAAACGLTGAMVYGRKKEIW